ncbi:MarR family winged helix-turn-helix transcriptional regulator [Lysobacter sp. 22409]|uniref:MarR family winged helix-turn-helix transcriptional regulator n=1 Tax=Lysobacter sp. 22409 TaxID=3453917 RepID=UPI003F8500C5
MPASRDIEILNLVNTIMHQATARMQRSLREAELGLAAMEARTLRFVARHRGCTQNDIVRESGRDKAQIARIIKTLLERGHVERIDNEAGEKRQRLCLTASGAETHAEAEALRTVVAKDLLHDLNQTERKQLEGLLRRMSHGPTSDPG